MKRSQTIGSIAWCSDFLSCRSSNVRGYGSLDRPESEYKPNIVAILNDCNERVYVVLRAHLPQKSTSTLRFKKALRCESISRSLLLLTQLPSEHAHVLKLFTSHRRMEFDFMALLVAYFVAPRECDNTLGEDTIVGAIVNEMTKVYLL